MTDEKSNQKNRPKKRSEMSDSERVQDLQRKLYYKAKQEPDYRFYILYDKIKLPHILREAYKRCKANKGKPGIDGQTFEQIEKSGTSEFIEQIRAELEQHSYRPDPVLRVYIPKANGKKRPLGIPTIRDRVIQMACKMVIEPIFEADFEEHSYGFRPKRSAKDAIIKIKENLENGLTEVYDADLSSYFDTIPHKELLFLIGLRIVDKHVLHLIKMWLKAPVFENGKMGGGKKNKRGTPQGGVISPLLANIYLHLLDKAAKRIGGIFRNNGIEIVRYADDFLLMGKAIDRKIIVYLYGLLERMKLTVNEEKSRHVKARNDSFDFLGFTFRYDKSLYDRNNKYWNVIPSKKSEKKLRENISSLLSTHGYAPPKIIAEKLNDKLRGWINYFTIPKTSYPLKAKRNIRWYLFRKMYRYYKRKSQRKCKLYNRGAYQILVDRYGLIDPAKYTPKTLANAL